MSIYGRDARTRFWTAFYTGYTVGALRWPLIDSVINEAILGLQSLALQLNKRVTPDYV